MNSYAMLHGCQSWAFNVVVEVEGEAQYRLPRQVRQ